MKLVPFVFGHGAWCDTWRQRVPAMADCDDAVAIDVLDDAADTKAVAFFRLMNAANARAFADLSMPAWVQLDCATLPTAMVGFALRRADVDRRAGVGVVADLEARAGLAGAVGDDDLVPVAEYCALPTPEAGHVVGFSLFSLVPGLGLRAKALGLLVMEARVQTGVTQVGNTALSTHCRFGPLLVEKRGVQVHSKPGSTLVYRLQVPASVLTSLASGALTRVPFSSPTVTKADLDAGDVVVDVGAEGFVVAA
jgi:hypothetical protein